MLKAILSIIFVIPFQCNAFAPQPYHNKYPNVLSPQRNSITSFAPGLDLWKQAQSKPFNPLYSVGVEDTKELIGDDSAAFSLEDQVR